MSVSIISSDNQTIAVLGGLRGAQGPAGTGRPDGETTPTQFAVLADVESAQISADVGHIEALRAVAGVSCPVIPLERVDSEPAHEGKVRSADRYLSTGVVDAADGGWWAVAGRVVAPEWVGAVRDGSANDRGALQNAIDVLEAKGGGTLKLSAGEYAQLSAGGDQLVVDGVEIVVEWAGAKLLWATAAGAPMFTLSNGGMISFIPQVSPKLFGAVGNGIADDSVAVQQFVNVLGGGFHNVGWVPGIFGLGSKVYARNAGTTMMAFAHGTGGFKGLSADGYIQFGDDTDLGNLIRPSGIRVYNCTFDGNFVADVGLWLGFGLNGPLVEACQFKGGVHAGLFIDQDVTAYNIVSCVWFRNGKSTGPVIDSIADGVLNFGTGQFVNCVTGGASGCGIRQVAAGSDPTGTVGFVEEQNLNYLGGRINACYEQLYRGEFHVAADLVVSGSAEFQRGEVVTDGTATGRFWNKIGTTVRLINVQGTFATGAITGADSGAADTVTTAHTAPFGATSTEIARVSFTSTYLENPGYYPGQDLAKTATQAGDGTFGIYIEGVRGRLQFRGGTKWQFRKVGVAFGAAHDAEIDLWLPPDCRANVDNDLVLRTELGQTFYEDGDAGTAQIRVHDWGGIISSAGASVTPAASLSPYAGWAGLIKGAPNFRTVGITGPNMTLVAEPLDGTTINLPGFADSAGTVSVDTTEYQSHGASLRFTADNATVSGKNISFDWTPPPSLIGKKCIAVAVMKLEQVGGVFGGTDGLPSPRMRVFSASGEGDGDCWPDASESPSNQDIPAPGAGNKTARFSISTSFIPLTGAALKMVAAMTTRSAVSDDIMYLDRIEIYRAEVDPVADMGAEDVFTISPARTLTAQATWDPGNIGNNSEETLVITVPGAELGDFVIASFSTDTLELSVSAQVTAAGAVSVTLANSFGSAVNMPSSTVKVLVFKA